jgi:hypothetical protein
VYVWAQGNPEGGTFEAIYQRLSGADGWQTLKVPWPAAGGINTPLCHGYPRRRRRPQALSVELTDDVIFNGRPEVDYVDRPTFVIIPVGLTIGTIEVDILSRLKR